MYLGYVNVTEALVASEIVLMVAAWYGAALFVETGARDVIFWGVLFAAASSALTYAYRTLTAMKVLHIYAHYICVCAFVF